MSGIRPNLYIKFDLSKLLGAVVVGCVICILGCGGSSSQDDDDGGTPLFQGEYSYVRFSSDRGGEDTDAEFTSGVGYADFDGAGNFSAGITATANGQAEGEAFLPGSFSGTYDVDSDGALTFDGEFAGFVSTDAGILIATDPIPEDPTYMETGISILIEEAVNHSNSNLNGRFSFVRFSSDRGGEDTDAEFTSGIGYINFDGAGNFSGETTGTANGQSDGEAFLPGSFSGTYNVAYDGEVTLIDGSVGFVSPDGSVVIWTDPIPENPTYRETGIAIGLKETSGLSNSSLNGRFSFVRFSSDRGGEDTDAEFTSGVGTIDFDGAGGFAGETTGTANGQSDGAAFLPGSFSGIYDVSPNGALTIEGAALGFVSGDGNIIIWTDPMPEDPVYMETGIAVGIKTN